eukprot:GHVU01077248.1.p1 GENE.GHVU01077248.1~~GHVU01077248.1.p1  ORF type:complete len:301 (-),score=70.54 GHVU01077248.1:1002-1904(-)
MGSNGRGPLPLRNMDPGAPTKAQFVQLRSPLLNSGEIVGPVDDLTANGEELVDRPVHHSLENPLFALDDVHVWTSRARKYKLEVIRCSKRIRELMEEVAQLRMQVEGAHTDFEGVDADSIQTLEECRRLQTQISESSQKKLDLQAETSSLKRHKESLDRTKRQTQEETGYMLDRIAALQSEVERNGAHHEAVRGEKEKLNLERGWFFRERLVLEKESERQALNYGSLKGELNDLRLAMQQIWSDSKRLDVLGHLRACKVDATHDEWYAARKRTFTRNRNELRTGQSYAKRDHAERQAAAS